MPNITKQNYLGVLLSKDQRAFWWVEDRSRHSIFFCSVLKGEIYGCGEKHSEIIWDSCKFNTQVAFLVLSAENFGQVLSWFWIKFLTGFILVWPQRFLGFFFNTAFNIFEGLSQFSKLVSGSWFLHVTPDLFLKFDNGNIGTFKLV